MEKRKKRKPDSKLYHSSSFHLRVFDNGQRFSCHSPLTSATLFL